MIIAIDGPAGSGKSTTAKLVAMRLGILHLDTGAMYRVITLVSLRHSIPYQDQERVGALTAKTKIRFAQGETGQRVFMDGEDVTDEIRSAEVTRNVSDYCAIPQVREILVAQQREIGRSTSCVLEGRDIGTVVFPNADFKFFLVASLSERARRRQKELADKGIQKDITELEHEIELRDRKDSSRSNSPLRKADDAVEIDTTALTIEQQVEKIVETVKRPALKD